MNKYKNTVKFCYIGYIVQAIVNNLLPLFFVIFREEYGIDNGLLGLLISLNFGIQLSVDLIATKFGARIGYRRAMIIAHICATVGLVSISVLPTFIDSLFIALTISTLFFAIGGGMIEVMVSPIMDSIDFGSKSGAMSLLHSFYCWGQVLVVAVSTLLISLFGDSYWRLLPLIWAIIPFLNIFPFIKTPLPKMISEKKRQPLSKLFKSSVFILLIILMISAGAFELSMAQWASYFAEKGLGISKTLGDLLGPCLFAIFMGVSRVLYGAFSSRLKLEISMAGSAFIGVICYLLAGISTNGYVALLGCALCGFSVGLMWPGTLSLAGRCFPSGGTAMFGVLAVAGDLGCSVGPWLTGVISSVSEKSPAIIRIGESMGLSAEQSGIKFGILCGIVFPITTIICVILEKKKRSALKNEKTRLS